MAGAFLYNNLATAQNTHINTWPVATMPHSNLFDAQPRRRMRAIDSAVTLYCDLGSDQVVECVALISTNLTSAATVRAFCFPSDPLADDAVWDTGIVSASTGPDVNGNVVLLTGSAVPGQYLTVNVMDGALGNIDLGIYAAGPLWRPSVGMAYGMREGRRIGDRRDRNPLTGAEFAVPAVANPRTISFTLPALTPTEVAGAHRDLVRILGAAGDGLWIPETGESRAEMNRRSIWGGINAPGADAVTERSYFALSARQFVLTERL